MASQEHDHSKIHDHGVDHAEVETKDRGMFDFLGKKKEGEEKKHENHPQEEVNVSEFNEKVKIEEEEEKKAEEEGEKKHGLVEKLHRTGSSSSSSSDEEGEGEEKKKKKKGHTLRETIDGEKKEEKREEAKYAFEHPPAHPGEKKYGEEVYVDAAHPTGDTVVHPEEKKGFVEKIKEKLPGHKKTEEAPPPLTHTPTPTTPTPTRTPTPTPTTEGVPHHEVHEGETAEKKGIMEKIKEKLPGHHAKEVKEKDGPY